MSSSSDMSMPAGAAISSENGSESRVCLFSGERESSECCAAESVREK
jgi:hypothetical protein